MKEKTEKKKYWWERILEKPGEEALRQQPFYCHLKNGKWDKKFRDKDGNVVE
jgi:hypothetical protein